MGAHDRHRVAAAEPGRDRRDRGVRRAGWRVDRARRDRAGEVRQQPERAAGAVRAAPGERHRPGLRALPQRAELDPGRPPRGRPRARRRPARARERGMPVPGHDDHLEQRRHRGGAHARDGVLAGRAADRVRHSRSGARGRAGRLRSVRRRLHRRPRPPRAVGQHRLLGVARGRRHVAGRGARGGRGAGPRLDPPARRDQRAGDAAGARRLAGRRSGRGARARDADDRRDRGAGAEVPARRGVPARGGRGPARVGLRQARLHARARAVPPRAPARRRDRAPRRVPDVQAERLARHVLRGADHPRAVAGLDRRARARALRQPQVRPGRADRRHARLRQQSARCCSPRRCRWPAGR